MAEPRQTPRHYVWGLPPNCDGCIELCLLVLTTACTKGQEGGLGLGGKGRKAAPHNHHIYLHG